MSTVEGAPPAASFVLDGVSWDTYVALRDAPENYHVRMTYDRGRLEVASPSRPHEQRAVLIDRAIQVWSEERNIPIASCRTMTLQREDLDRGLEPDDCYYVQHEAEVRGSEAIDLAVDPPPDLAVEVTVSRSAVDKMALYAALGVPEVWQSGSRSIEVLLLEGGSYREAAESAALPGFPFSEVRRMLDRADSESETQLVREFRERVRAGAPRS